MRQGSQSCEIYALQHDRRGFVANSCWRRRGSFVAGTKGLRSGRSRGHADAAVRAGRAARRCTRCWPGLHPASCAGAAAPRHTAAVGRCLSSWALCPSLVRFPALTTPSINGSERGCSSAIPTCAQPARNTPPPTVSRAKHHRAGAPVAPTTGDTIASRNHPTCSTAARSAGERQVITVSAHPAARGVDPKPGRRLRGLRAGPPPAT